MNFPKVRFFVKIEIWVTGSTGEFGGVMKLAYASEEKLLEAGISPGGPRRSLPGGRPTRRTSRTSRRQAGRAPDRRAEFACGHCRSAGLTPLSIAENASYNQYQRCSS